MTIVGYIRHSKAEQGRRMSPALQRRAIEKWAQGQGVAVDAWFTDSAPGSTPIAKRPGLRDALAQLGPESVLIVYRLDRLARDLELQIRLFRIVTSAGARIVSTMDEGTINGPGDDDPDAEFLRNLQGALAQRERGVMAVRIRDGIRAKKAQGLKWNGQAPYGHRWDARDKLAENVAEQRTIALVVELRAQGVTYRGILAELKKLRRFSRKVFDKNGDSPFYDKNGKLCGGNRPFTLSQIQAILRRAG